MTKFALSHQLRLWSQINHSFKNSFWSVKIKIFQKLEGGGIKVLLMVLMLNGNSQALRKKVAPEEKIRYVTAPDLNKNEKHVKQQRLLLTCAHISALPSNLSTWYNFCYGDFYNYRYYTSKKFCPVLYSEYTIVKTFRTNTIRAF